MTAIVTFAPRNSALREEQRRPAAQGKPVMSWIIDAATGRPVMTWSVPVPAADSLAA